MESILKPGAVVVLPRGVDAEYIPSSDSGKVVMRFTAISEEGLRSLEEFFSERALGDEFREAVQNALSQNVLG